MITCTVPKTSARRKINATDTGLVKRLRTQTFGMPASSIQRNLLLMAARISLKKDIMTESEHTHLIEKITFLKEIQKEYPGRNIDNIIMQLESRRKEVEK